jgi:hypothetical protein
MASRAEGVVLSSGQSAGRAGLTAVISKSDTRDGTPFSTVPGTILAALPTLPDGVEYRFLGRHLILFDVRAGVILDRIPYAIQCVDCDEDLPLHKRHPRD